MSQANLAKEGVHLLLCQGPMFFLLDNNYGTVTGDEKSIAVHPFNLSLMSSPVVVCNKSVSVDTGPIRCYTD